MTSVKESSDIVRRPQQFQKISQFVFTSLSKEFRKTVRAFIKFCGLLTIFNIIVVAIKINTEKIISCKMTNYFLVALINGILLQSCFEPDESCFLAQILVGQENYVRQFSRMCFQIGGLEFKLLLISL